METDYFNRTEIGYGDTDYREIEFVGQESHEPLSADWTAVCPHAGENGCMPESDEELEGALNCCRELDWCVATHKPGERPDICQLCKAPK